MASENTHIYIADRIRREISGDSLKRFISDHIDYYFLGSIFPDILFYSKDKQIVSLTRSRFYFVIFQVLCKLGFFPAKIIAGFQENLKKDKTCLPDPIQYKDVITGEPQKTTLNDLIEEAIQFGSRMIETAHAYYTGRIEKDECEKVIAGHSLETGRVGKRTEDIRYTASLI